MLARTVQSLVGLVAVGGLLWLVFVVSFRTRFRPVHNAIRRLNRRVLNPWQLRTAGQPGAWASVVHHVGRTSGTAYRTPVVTVPTRDGFVVALPYGPDADWVRNVLAAGSATIDHQGQTIAVERPGIVGAGDADVFSRREQRTHRLYGVTDFLLLRTRDHGRSGGWSR